MTNRSIQNHMKLKFAILATASIASANAAMVFQDSFNYADEAAMDAAYLFDDAGKTHFNPAGLTSTLITGATGGHAQFLSDRIKAELGQTFGTSDGTLYMSYLAQSNVNFSDNLGIYRTVELYNSALGADANLNDGDAERRYSIGLLRNDGDTASAEFEHRYYGLANTATPGLGAFNDGVNLFVVKFNFTNGGADFTADAWMNPDGATTDFGAASNRITGSGLVFDSFGIVSFAENVGTGAEGASYDEIRFGTEIADLQLVPEPSTALLGLLGILGLLRRRR